MMRITCLLFSLLASLSLSADPLVIPANSSWHLQLNGKLKQPERRVYDIDLYDTHATTIANLKARGRIVICYFSAGTLENWRPDASLYPQTAIGAALPDWPGERWLDVRRSDVRELLARRLDLAVEKGCDGVDPDNVDGYSNANGLGLTSHDQIDFNRWLAQAAHQRQLSVGLKNAIEILPELHEAFDFAINESCYRFQECSAYQLFSSQGKPVFIAEYRSYSKKLCQLARNEGFQLQFFKRNLKGIGKPCP